MSSSTFITPLPPNNNTLQTLTQQKNILLEENRNYKYKVFVTCNGIIIWNLQDMRNRMFTSDEKDIQRFSQELLGKYSKSHIPGNFYIIYYFYNDRSFIKIPTEMDYRLFGLEKMMLHIKDFKDFTNNNNYGYFVDPNNNSLNYLRNKKKKLQ